MGKQWGIRGSPRFWKLLAAPLTRSRASTDVRTPPRATTLAAHWPAPEHTLDADGCLLLPCSTPELPLRLPADRPR